MFKFIAGIKKGSFSIISGGETIFSSIHRWMFHSREKKIIFMTDIDNISDELLADYKDELLAGYKKGKRSELHDIIIKHCQRYIAKLEADKKLGVRICLVEGPEIAYYFDGDEINFTHVIPTGGTLVTWKNVFIAMNTNHYLESCMYSQI